MGAMLGTRYAMEGARGAGAPCLTTTAVGSNGDRMNTAAAAAGGGAAPGLEDGDSGEDRAAKKVPGAGGAASPAASAAAGGGTGGTNSQRPAVGVGIGPAASSVVGRGFNVDARMRVQWQEITAMCNWRNYSSCRSVDRSTWTEASKSEISGLDFAGLGAWSTFKITSRDKQGRLKTKGGDTWAITLREDTHKLKWVPTCLVVHLRSFLGHLLPHCA